MVPTIDSIDLNNKIVLLRIDLDVTIKQGKVLEEERIDVACTTIKHIIDKGASKIILLSHKGRPEGVDNEEFSLKPLIEIISEKLSQEISFVGFQPFGVFYQVQEQISASHTKIVLLENLRFWKEEEENNQAFAQELAYMGEVYINEAFANSHRAHASMIGIPRTLHEPKIVAGGSRLITEVENLTKLISSPSKPVIAVVSGVKKDKLDYVEKFKNFCDKILIGGKLPHFLPEDNSDPQLEVAKLNPDKEDITIRSIEKFEKLVEYAGTIILSGPIGMYEDPGHLLGTKRVFTAIAESKAYKVAGGGDTIAAINVLGLKDKFNWISIGGGAMLEFLSNGKLPGIEVLNK